MSENEFRSLWSDAQRVEARHDPNDNVLPSVEYYGDLARSGNRVSVASLLRYGPAFGAVSLISKDVAKLPLRVFRLQGDAREEARGHPLWRVLNRRPNGYMTPYIWKLQTSFHLLTYGNAYSIIVRDSQSRVQELLPLDPTHVNVRVIRSDGEWFYEVAFSGEKGFERVSFTPERILHVRGIGDESSGFSISNVGRESIGLATATQEFTQRFFQKGASGSVAFVHPQSLDDEAYANLRRSIDSKYAGLENSWRPWLLEEDMRVQQISSSAEDAQLSELREQSIREVANYWGVPPHRLGDTSKSSFASLEEENRSYLDTALDPVLCNLEDELEFKLLGTKDSISHDIEFDRSRLTRANLADQATYYQGMVDRGIMSPAEVRKKLGENPDDRTDVILIPQNMHVIQDAADLASLNEIPSAEGDGDGETGTSFRDEAEGYGVAVRAGVITPQRSDEDLFRAKAGLPPAGAEIDSAWTKDEGARRPVTLSAPNPQPEADVEEPREPPPDDQGDLDDNEPGEEVSESVRALAEVALKAFGKRLDDHVKRHGPGYWDDKYETLMRPFLMERFAFEELVDTILSRSQDIRTAAKQPVDLVPQLLPLVLEKIT